MQSSTDLATTPSFDLTSMQLMDEKIKGLAVFMKDVLEKGVTKDWEHAHVIWKRQAPANPEDYKAALLDPGTAKICNYMGVRPRHKILEKEIDEKSGQLRYVIVAELVPYLPTIFFHPQTGEPREVYPIVAEGVGSCTTREKKYKVRWGWQREKNLITVEGYRPKELEDYRTQYPERFVPKEDGQPDNMYYMADSESLGLDNTLLKMAAKRAEMDAVMQLPGVAQRFSQEADLDGNDKQHPQAVPTGPVKDVVDFMKKDRLRLPETKLPQVLQNEGWEAAEAQLAAFAGAAGINLEAFHVKVDGVKIELKKKEQLDPEVEEIVAQILVENGFTVSRGVYRLNKKAVEAWK